MTIVQMKRGMLCKICMGRAEYFGDNFGRVRSGYPNGADSALTGRRDYRRDGIVIGEFDIEILRTCQNKS